MIITIIQDRPVRKCGNDYFFGNYSDFIKYGALCDHLYYCASVRSVNDRESLKNNKTSSDFPKVSIIEVEKSPLKELIHFSNYNQRQVKMAIDYADLVIVKIPSITIGKWAVNYLKTTKKKYILEVIGCAWDSIWNHSLKGKLIAPFSYYYTKKMIKNAPYVIYVSNEFLEKRYPTRGEWIGCSNVVLQEHNYSILDERKEIISRIDENTILSLGTVGAISSKYKGHKYVVEAMAKFKSEGVFFNYYIAGGGENKKLKEMVHAYGLDDYVHFLGSVPRNCMEAYYKSLDIYIHPSIAEGLPRVVIEAESYALPACGARAAGTPELLDERFVFKKKSAEDIYRVLKMFTKEVMIEQATQNFKRTEAYLFDSLNKRRGDFYKHVLYDNQ